MAPGVLPRAVRMVAALGVPLFIAAYLVVSRALGRASAAESRLVGSFAGGVSLAFVMLELLAEVIGGSDPELHDVVRLGPEPLHTTALLLLAGTAATFAAAVYAEHHAGTPRYVVASAPNAAYALLVGAALVEEAREGVRGFTIFWLAMALHLGIVDRRLAGRFPREHRAVGRAVLAGSLLAGAVVWSLAAPHEGLVQVLLANVAGATLFGVFRDEIPSTNEARLGAFFAGIFAFGALMQLRWWL